MKKDRTDASGQGKDSLLDDMLLRAIFEQTGEGISIADKTGRYIAVNPGFCHMTGYSERELLNMEISDLLPEGADNTLFLKTIKGGSGKREAQLLKKNGEKFWAEISAYNLNIKTGRIALGIVRDITDRKNMEKELHRNQIHYTDFINHSTNPVSYWKVPDGCRIDLPIQEQIDKLYAAVCQDGNRVLWENFRLKSKEELVGKKYQELVPGRFQDKIYTDFIKQGYRLDNHEYYEVNDKGDEYYGLESWFGIIEEGELRYVWTTGRDITNLKKTEMALVDSEIRLKEVLDYSSDIILSVDREYRLLTINSTGRSYFRSYFNQEVEIGEVILQYLPPDLSDTWKARYDRALSGEQYDVEDAYEGEGQMLYTEASFYPIMGPEGITGVSVFSHEITERKLAEAALQESEEKYQKAYENVSHAVYLSSIPEGRLVEVNKAFESISGYTKEELVGKTVEELNFYVRPEDRTSLLSILQQEGKLKGYEIYYRIKSGEHRLCSVNAEIVVIGGRNYLVGVIEDITEKRNAELAVVSERDRARQYLDIAGVIMVAIDQNQQISMINRKGCEILGYPEHELIGLNWFDTCLPEENRELVRGNFHRIISGDLAPAEYFENEIISREGKKSLIAWHNTLIRDESGEIIGTLSSGEDITSRRQSENKIRESELKFRTMVETSPDGVTTFDLDGNITYVSKQKREIHGYEESDNLIGSPVNIFIAPEEREELRTSMLDRITKRATIRRNVTLLKKDGTRFHGELSASAIEDEKNQAAGIISITRDITDRIASERALVESEGKFRQLINNIDSLFWIVTPDWQEVIYVSPPYEKMWGKSVDSVYKNALSWTDPILEEDRDMVLSTIQGYSQDRDIIELPDYRIMQPEGGILWIRSKGYMVRDASGNVTRIAGIAEDITIRKKTEEVVQDLVGDTSGFTGEAYFRNLVNKLSSILEADYVFIATAIPGKKDMVESIALSHQGEIADNISYSLKNTPCQLVYYEGHCHYQGDVQQQYPKDKLLIDMGITSYSGISLIDTHSNILGILVVLNQDEFQQTEFVKSILQLSAIRAGAELERMNAEKELQKYQDNLRYLASELASVEDREKRSIAEYLHDNLGQSLALAKIKIGRTLRREPDSEITEVLNDIESDLTDAINYSQSVIYELSPPILYELGLVEALKWKMNEFETKQGIQTMFRAPRETPDIKQDMAIILFRSVTELLNNVVKHAAATAVELDLKKVKNRLVLIFSDNGIGFTYDPGDMDNSKSQKFGLFSIQERIKYHGGEINIQAPEQGGTVISIFVPLE